MMKGGEGLGVEDDKDQGTQRLPGGTVDAPFGTWLWARSAFWEQGSVKYIQTPQRLNI
jgi:hypothetical protein